MNKGLTGREFKQFMEFLIKANAKQLTHIIEETYKEMIRRMGL